MSQCSAGRQGDDGEGVGQALWRGPASASHCLEPTRAAPGVVRQVRHRQLLEGLGCSFQSSCSQSGMATVALSAAAPSLAQEGMKSNLGPAESPLPNLYLIGAQQDPECAGLLQLEDRHLARGLTSQPPRTKAPSSHVCCIAQQLLAFPWPQPPLHITTANSH